MINPAKKSPEIFQFPPHFFWGAATSSHQVEGGNVHNDWWQWEQSGRLAVQSLNACEHYERFEPDFDLAKSLHHNAHRFSIEWSRIQPEKHRWNEKEFEHYNTVLQALLRRGIEPVVTLHHFTLPVWAAEEGGWENPKIVDDFGEYVKQVMEAFGDKVTYWVTINEPMVLLFKSYFVGEWPPGYRSPERALRALRHVVLAHVRAYEIIHEVCAARPNMKKPLVGFAGHLSIVSACSPGSWKDRLSAWLRHFFSNHLLIRSLRSGFLFFPGIFWEPLPIRRALDFIGVNYYTRHFLHFGGFGFPGILGDECTLEHHASAGPRNDMGWEIYPKGIFDLLMELKGYRLPVFILENGICTEDDSIRREFIRRHLIEVAHAMAKKVPVAGYLHWSLMDNFEWEHGFKPRFGLIGVDYPTQTRHIRESARYLADIAKANSISLGP